MSKSLAVNASAGFIACSNSSILICLSHSSPNVDQSALFSFHLFPVLLGIGLLVLRIIGVGIDVGIDTSMWA